MTSEPFRREAEVVFLQHPQTPGERDEIRFNIRTMFRLALIAATIDPSNSARWDASPLQTIDWSLPFSVMVVMMMMMMGVKLLLLLLLLLRMTALFVLGVIDLAQLRGEIAVGVVRTVHGAGMA
uniref:Uncharacterized protein n=1 Tax=Anopheles farauti TaxID=69004 RepID=A0A182Q4A4_9DIPT